MAEVGVLASLQQRCTSCDCGSGNMCLAHLSYAAPDSGGFAQGLHQLFYGCSNLTAGRPCEVILCDLVSISTLTSPDQSSTRSRKLL